jgi:hypothetical protein
VGQIKVSKVDHFSLSKAMIQGGSELIEDFPNKDAEGNGDFSSYMIGNYLLDSLVVVIGNDAVGINVAKELGNLRIQIEDVLVGPFELSVHSGQL